MSPKYAPAREDGKKPYVVTIMDWGKTRERIGWGKTVADAKYNAAGRSRPGMHVSRARRATPEDMETIR